MLSQIKTVFFLGIKGVAMTNLALILKKMGKIVTGYDVKEEFITDEILQKNKINWSSDDKNLPENIDLFVYSASHGGINNYLTQLAIKRKIKVISQPELINEIMSLFKYKIAICGCHGKTTTSSFLSYTLIQLNQKPSYLVGTSSFNNYLGSNYEKIKNFFVVEADEYGVSPPFDKRIKLTFLKPDWIICGNIDYDHPDVYSDLSEVKKVFFQFFDKRNLIINIDDKNLFQFYQQNKKSNQIITFGFNQEAKYQILKYKIVEEGTIFKVKNLGNFKITLYGLHNVYNTVSIIIFLLELGFSLKEVRTAIIDFKGAKRRFELIYKNNFMVFDDYAHHPKEIKVVIETARKIFKGKEILIIFQPHTFSRTQLFLKEFVESLSLADKVFILPIFPSARENPKDFKISSLDLVKYNKNKFKYCEDKNEILFHLRNMLKKGEVVFTLGAGDVYKIGNEIKNNFKLNEGLNF